MAKRNVNFIKPEDPAFLKALKKQAGYEEPLNHKFDDLNSDFAGDEDTEQPQVVVLKAGDLTAEEAEAEQKRIQKEEEETPADLSQRVVFQKKRKTEELTHADKRKRREPVKIVKQNPSLLSFDDDEDEDED